MGLFSFFGNVFAILVPTSNEIEIGASNDDMAEQTVN